MSNPLIGSILGTKLQFTSLSFPDHVVGHSDFEIVLKKNDKSDRNLMYDSSFYVVPGLNGSNVSFKSCNYPDMYLGHRDFECFIMDPSKNPDRYADFTWEVHQDLAGAGGNALSFSSNGLYMFHQNFRVKVARISGDHVFQKDASWVHNIDTNPEYARTAIGEWVMIFGYDGNAESWEFTTGINVGMSVSEGTSTTKTNTVGWKTSLEVSGGAFGKSVQAMAEASGEHSVSQMDSQSFNKSKNVTSTSKLSGVKADGPLYIWQWVVKTKTAEQYSLTIESLKTMETKTREVPTVSPY